ncbi:transmembrane protein 26-like [Ruditapes philippinarum]|uniref:transmembrane protein 26-like n=1 Tax=Ruditapes philippinarum TaxID=129788 RepID=UPI00295AB5FC|nr:transmembrane protein 26-like [Ruditapes philippinarum]
MVRKTVTLNGVKQKISLDSLIFRSDFHKYRKIFRAILTRLLLLTHCVVAILIVAKTVDVRFYGIFAPYIFFFLLETSVILYCRWGCEWSRICTCFCIYLSTVVPVLWILRLHDANQDGGSAKGLNDTTTTATATNTTTIPPLSITNGGNNTSDELFQASKLTTFLLNVGPISLLEQSMMFLVILCRWLLPRGRIDRNSLSQLLIMYSAISADILDFSEIFNKDQIKHSGPFRYVVLGVWSWSLVQFVVVITTSFAIKRHERNTVSRSQDRSEILSVLMVLFMQDGPFLGVRCYAIFYIHISEYLIMFFSLKNALTLILGFYRLLVLCDCISTEGNDLLRKSEIARSMESLDDLEMEEDFSKKKGKKRKKDTRNKTRY